jgi:hypothetical protein
MRANEDNAKRYAANQELEHETCRMKAKRNGESEAEGSWVCEDPAIDVGEREHGWCSGPNGGGEVEETMSLIRSRYPGKWC